MVADVESIRDFNKDLSFGQQETVIKKSDFGVTKVHAKAYTVIFEQS
uniref:Uncharacterized protein n=1 Tax=Tetranychus urticae TaxID=32264 RepID=T1KLB7_TETUR